MQDRASDRVDRCRSSIQAAARRLR